MTNPELNLCCIKKWQMPNEFNAKKTQKQKDAKFDECLEDGQCKLKDGKPIWTAKEIADRYEGQYQKSTEKGKNQPTLLSRMLEPLLKALKSGQRQPALAQRPAKKPAEGHRLPSESKDYKGVSGKIKDYHDNIQNIENVR